MEPTVAEILLHDQLNWDERVEVHAASEYYSLNRWMKDRCSISDAVAFDLPHIRAFLPDGSPNGMRVLHFQCHFGIDTLSWSRLGANATGLDFSLSAIRLARSIASDLRLDARFVHSTVQNAGTTCGGMYDLVYVNVGSLMWLPELGSWARTIQKLLAPEGVLYIREIHPVTLQRMMSRRMERSSCATPISARSGG